MSKLPVFFSPKMVSDSGSFSPSAGKPAALMAAWRASGFPIEVIEPTPATEAQLCRVHDPEYVRGVLSCERPNGFGNRRPDVAASLPWTSGSMLSAARYALAHPEAPAPCSPSSGFHHASWGHGGGFCSFNALCMTAMALLDDGLVRRVGICDLDAHFGDGTEDILDRLHLRDRIDNYTVGAHHHGPQHAERFMRELPGIVERMAIDCDLILYQAGQDLHRDDPLGGVLSTEQMIERDRVVFETCLRVGTASCFNLAGGYRKDAKGEIPEVVAGHTATARAALAAAAAT